MKLNAILVCALTLGAYGCSAPGPTKAVGGKPLIARTALLDECPNSPHLNSAGTTEIGFAEFGAKTAVAVAEKIIDEIAKAISEAAANDAKAFTVSGSSPEYLYQIIDKDKVTMNCLIIAVGPHVKNADPCGVGVEKAAGAVAPKAQALDQQAADHAAAAANAKAGGERVVNRDLTPIGPPQADAPVAAPASPAPALATPAAVAPAAASTTTAWLGSEQSCDPSSAVARKMRSWGMGAPIFYAEVRLVTPVNGPVGYVQPTVIRAYYPAPVSDLEVKKIKDVALSVQGVLPSAGLEGGKPVLSLGFASSWLRPGTDYTASKSDLTLDKYGLTAPTFGHWLAVPMDVKGLGTDGGFGGPVNMQTTFTEVPDPSKWLQELAKFVDKNKEKAKTEAKESIELAMSEEKQAKKALDERVAQRALEAKALDACTPLKDAIATVAAADIAVQAAPDEGAKAAALVKLGSACLKAQGQYESTSSAWQDAGKPESLCFLPEGGWPNSGCAKP